MADLEAIRNQLLWRPQTALLTARLSTVVAASATGGAAQAEFSAFVLQVPINDADAQFVVVSARHCVTSALAIGAEVLIRVPLRPERIDPANPPSVFETMEVQVDAWHFHEATDAAVAPLRLERLPDNHFLCSWDRSAFVGVAPDLIRDDVVIFGRAVLGRRSFVVRRDGVLATYEHPTVSLEIEPNTYRDVLVYVVEANVTDGMGGFVIWTHGNFWGGENIGLGLVHGYAYPNLDVEKPWAANIGDENLAHALHTVQREIEAARNGLVYVIPGQEIIPLVDAVACRSAEAQGVANPQVGVPG